MSANANLAIPTDVAAPVNDFFRRNIAQRGEIMEALIREHQLAAFAGPFGVGKTPILADIVMHVLTGVPWCGRSVQRRPVVHFDFETPGPVYKANLQNIATRLGLPVPRVPEELDVYLEHDNAEEPNTRKLLEALAQPKFEARLRLIENAITTRPNALIIIDPLELLFRIDTGKKQHVLLLYGELRQLLSKYPQAAMLITFNLRKWKRDGIRPNLLSDPRAWLEEVCGTLDILNRSDVRLGMDFYDEEFRVINGVRHGEDMQPMLLRSVGIGEERLAGFELCPVADLNLSAALTPKQFKFWSTLRPQFRFDEVADHVVPRASLHRLLNRAKSLGLIEQDNGTWKKKGNGETSG